MYGHEAVLSIEINLQTILEQRQNESSDDWDLMFDKLNNLDEERLVTLENIVR